MNFPKEKYNVITLPNKVIAVSTYAGKTVKGVAKVDPRDQFDAEIGKELAIARCAAKIAAKREKRAEKKVASAVRQLATAQAYAERMNEYLKDSVVESDEALKALAEVIKKVQ